MTDSKFSINIEEFISNDSKVLNGRKLGVEIFERTNFKEAFTNQSTIEICIPDRIISLGTTFFLGLFGEVIREYGEKVFSEKVFFNNNIMVGEDIKQGIYFATNRLKVFQLNES